MSQCYVTRTVSCLVTFVSTFHMRCISIAVLLLLLLLLLLLSPVQPSYLELPSDVQAVLWSP